MLCGGVTGAAAQHVAEVRVGDTKYRFADWSYTWPSGPVVDVFYVGVPGSNELNAGGGYAIKIHGATLTPLGYAVLGKEDGQRGIKIALLASLDANGWKVLSFAGAYVHLAGEVDHYQVLDTLDVTRTVNRVELGVQSGFFHAGGAWNTQIGPLIKLNDRKGAWSLSYRFGGDGADNELRFGRTLLF